LAWIPLRFLFQRSEKRTDHQDSRWGISLS
jgi:hypothetical protein